MADEVIRIEVDDAELDAAIAKLEEALAKKGLIVEPGAEAKTTEAELEDLQAKAENVKETAEEAKATTDEAVDVAETHDIKGTNLAARRIMTQIPGLREGYQLVSRIRMLMRVSPEIALLLGAFMLGQALWGWLEDQKKAAEEYRKLVMGYRGFTFRSEFDAWLEEDRRRTQEAYRGAVPS